MQDITIKVTIKGKKFESHFTTQSYVPEYVIADEAYRIGIMFADTQAIALFGHPLSAHEFADFLQDLDYTYEIKEVA